MEISIETGKTYRLRLTPTIANRPTQDQFTHFRIIELRPYRGALICYGETFKYQNRVAPLTETVQDVPERASCPVIIPGATSREILTLTGLLNGSPIAIMSERGAGEIPVLNMAHLKGFFDLTTYDMQGKGGVIDLKNQMINHAGDLIDIWNYWKLGGNLPMEIVQLQTEAKAGVNVATPVDNPYPFSSQPGSQSPSGIYLN